jgi:hypothetical protein
LPVPSPSSHASHGVSGSESCPRSEPRGRLSQHALEDRRRGPSGHPAGEPEPLVPPQYPRGDGGARRSMVRHQSAAPRARRAFRSSTAMRRLRVNGRATPGTTQRSRWSSVVLAVWRRNVPLDPGCDATRALWPSPHLIHLPLRLGRRPTRIALAWSHSRWPPVPPWRHGSPGCGLAVEKW